MNNIKESYSKIVKGKNDINKEIWNLQENPVVKKYIELQAKRNELDFKERELYKLIKTEEYENCDHIWVISEERGDYDYACIKCGYNTKVPRLVANGKDDNLSFDEMIMKNLSIKPNCQEGINLDIVCDLELAMAIYQKIKEHYPDIDDRLASCYVKKALTDIKDIEVNEERKESRRKRLNLS